MHNKVSFIPTSFWDKQTMTLEDRPTKEQFKQVENICYDLNIKYQHEKGCLQHPTISQKVCVSLFNGFVDFQVAPADTCGCHDIVVRLLELRDAETDLFNGGYVRQ
jgi:hypothetical protein